MTAISNSSKREVRLGELFVTIADTLVADFDLSDLLQTLVDETVALLPVDQAALFLASGDGDLRVASATSSHARAVEDLILEVDASPCLDAYRSGTPAGVDTVDAAKPEWGEFASILRAARFEASHAIPMRLRGETIGVLSLFSEYAYVPSESDAAVAQSLADAATIAILQTRVASERLRLTEQLQRALESRDPRRVDGRGLHPDPRSRAPHQRDAARGLPADRRPHPHPLTSSIVTLRQSVTV